MAVKQRRPASFRRKVRPCSAQLLWKVFFWQLIQSRNGWFPWMGSWALYAAQLEKPPVLVFVWNVEAQFGDERRHILDVLLAQFAIGVLLQTPFDVFVLAL